MQKELNNFFHPKIIAIIGASENPEKVGSVLMKKLKEFKGKTIPINPNHNYIEGKKSYNSVLKCPWKIDLAIIAIPAEGVVHALEQCGQKGIRNAIIISAGFGEIGNIKLENQLLAIANKYKIKILGPNCFGIANPYVNLDTTFSNTSPKPGNTAFLSQSGALFSYVSDFPIGFSGFVSLGNQAMLTFNDFIKYFNQDVNTKKIVLYIEKLKNGREFVKICQKSKKPIVIIKAGQTKKGTQATISHTGSLATEFKVYEGAFKQARIKVVSSLAQAFGLKKQGVVLPNKIKKVKIITNAGGAAALLTDELSKKGIEVEIKDLLGTTLAKDYEKEIKNTKEKESIIVILTPQKMSEPVKTAQAIINSKRKDIIACFLGDRSVKRAIDLLKQNNIQAYTTCC